MNTEVERFKKILEWFVTQLKINNDIIPGIKRAGQGYKGHAIRDEYSQWRKYDEFTLDCALQLGYAKDKHGS